MKKLYFKTGLISALCITAAAYANIVSAHDLPAGLTNGVLSGAGAGATDVYSVTCFDDSTAPSRNPSDHLRISIRDDSSAGGQVSATAILNSVKAVTVTDTTPADGIASASKALKAPAPNQNLTFLVLVHHTAAAGDNYLLSFHCEDSANLHTGTIDPPDILQNQ